ncbi:MAG: deoxynucleoside monophosphate kinase [Bacteriophage sp.]|nr:MAG: deoxynucleoside monophosphate kinase [Bacteriophage sp.]
MVNVIILSGKMHSGKDTFADKLKLMLEKQSDSVYKISYADSTKSDMVKIIKLILHGRSVEGVMKVMDIGSTYGYQMTKIFNYINQDLADNADLKSEFYSLNNEELQLKLKQFRHYRLIMQIYGTEIRRSLDSKYWINKVLDKIHRIFDDNIGKNVDVIVPDGRFKNEIKLGEDLDSSKYKVLTVRLEAPTAVIKSRIKNDPNDQEEISKETFSHSSETELDEFKNFDFFVDTTNQNMMKSTMKKLLDLTR